MDLIQALRTTGAIRAFTGDPVPDEVVARILDNARFAPSGGNAQAWHVVLVKDPATRRALRDLYRPGWRDYLAMSAAGLRPWAPVNDPAEEAAALAAAPPAIDEVAAQGFAAELDRVPVLLAIFADLAALAAVDRDLPRYPMAGGASVYPFAWNVLLAAHSEGLGGVMTTMLVREEDTVRELLGAPKNWVDRTAEHAWGIKVTFPEGEEEGNLEVSYDGVVVSEYPRVRNSRGWIGISWKGTKFRIKNLRITGTVDPKWAIETLEKAGVSVSDEIKIEAGLMKAPPKRDDNPYDPDGGKGGGKGEGKGKEVDF